MTGLAIAANGLRKSYGDQTVLGCFWSTSKFNDDPK